MNEKYGVEALQECIISVVKVGNKLNEILDDGKVSLFESVSLVPALIPLKESISNGKKIKQEFIDMSEVERDQLILVVKGELDLSGEAKEWVDWALDVLDTIGDCPAFN